MSLATSTLAVPILDDTRRFGTRKTPCDNETLVNLLIPIQRAVNGMI